MTPLSSMDFSLLSFPKPCHGPPLRKPSFHRRCAIMNKPGPASPPSPSSVWTDRHCLSHMRALDQALLPAARGTMVQHQTDSSVDNVTLSVQSWLHEAGMSRRAAAVAPDTPCDRPRWAHLWLFNIFMRIYRQMWVCGYLIVFLLMGTFGHTGGKWVTDWIWCFTQD